MLPTNSSGIPVTQKTAEGIAAVYGCCSLIADSVASLPIELRSGPILRNSRLLPVSPLLEQPYAEISRRDWWIQFIWALALRGNFFGRFIEFGPDGLPVQIKPIHNDNVVIDRDKNTGALVYRFYGKIIPLNEVFHVRNQTTAGNVVGLSPIQSSSLTFGNAIAQQRFVESFFLNSANPMGVIEVPGYLDRVETRRMMRGWLSLHQGLNKANLPAILTEGATFKPISISPADAQLLDAMGFTEQQIVGRIFRVPLHMMGLNERTSSFGRGIEIMERSYFANCLIGYLTTAREAMTRLHRPGEFVYFDTTERTRGAVLERAQAAALLMNSGVARADDVRPWFDWADLPGGDGKLSFMPINSQLVDAAELALKQMKQALNAPPPVPGALPAANTTGSARPSANVPTHPTNGNGNGQRSTEEMIYVLEQFVDQARGQQQRMNRAADQALLIRPEDIDEN